MDKPAKAVIMGFVAAGVIVLVGKANTMRLESKLRDLQVACEQEDSQRQPSGPGKKLKLICDPKDLVQPETTVGIQAQLVQAQKDVWSSDDWPIPIAVTVFLLSALPWAWYFLLRRIRELRDAILGK